MDRSQQPLQPIERSQIGELAVEVVGRFCICQICQIGATPDAPPAVEEAHPARRRDLAELLIAELERYGYQIIRVAPSE